MACVYVSQWNHFPAWMNNLPVCVQHQGLLLPSSASRRCQGFRVRAACTSGAAPLSYISARHGGGAAARVDFCSPVFLELWGYSGRSGLLPQVNMPSKTRNFTSVYSFLLGTKANLCVAVKKISLSLPLSTAKKPRVQPGCIQSAERHL